MLSDFSHGTTDVVPPMQITNQSFERKKKHAYITQYYHYQQYQSMFNHFR